VSDLLASTSRRALAATPPIPDPLLSDRDVERITKRSRSTLQKDRLAGTGIPFVRIGRLVRYRQSDVAAFLDALPSRRSTSEADAR
jgi:predicted DNA-binding transcriptional regulator AlpA